MVILSSISWFYQNQGREHLKDGNTGIIKANILFFSCPAPTPYFRILQRWVHYRTFLYDMPSLCWLTFYIF